MKPLVSFFNIEDLWEIEHLKSALPQSVSVKTFKETVDLVLAKIQNTTIFPSFINFKVDKKAIDA